MASSKNDGTMFSLLHVEDEQDAGNLIGRIITLKFPDMRLFKAEDGEIGLEMFKEHKPDMVLTDIAMPKLDGLSMAAEIKAVHPETPIVVISANCFDQRYILRLKEIGVEQCLPKPLDIDLLFAAIRKHCILR